MIFTKEKNLTKKEKIQIRLLTSPGIKFRHSSHFRSSFFGEGGGGDWVIRSNDTLSITELDKLNLFKLGYSGFIFGSGQFSLLRSKLMYNHT